MYLCRPLRSGSPFKSWRRIRAKACTKASY
jgi:hypothetical protein